MRNLYKRKRAGKTIETFNTSEQSFFMPQYNPTISAVAD